LVHPVVDLVIIPVVVRHHQGDHLHPAVERLAAVREERLVEVVLGARQDRGGEHLLGLDRLEQLAPGGKDECERRQGDDRTGERLAG